MGVFMRKSILLIFTLLLSINFAYSKSCKLAKDQTLRIGCTTKCKYFYKKALKRFAWKKGYNLEIVDMYKDSISQDLSGVDGIVIPGGADINPDLYKNKVEPDLRKKIEELDYLVDYSSEGDRRDPFEAEVLGSYFNDNSNKSLPILGICRGMQMLAVSQGIPLYVDIKAELGIKNRRYLMDRIHLEDENSLIKSILKYSHFWGYKYHHQGIRVDYFNKYQSERWPNIKITSYSNKKRIAESLEFEGRPILGTQFHPEIDFWTERKRIFSWLLNESCFNKKKKLMTNSTN